MIALDKEEYRIRLESIRTLAAQQDFSTAAQVADTIDWKRVKSVRTLCMIGEIYEAAERPEDAGRVLQCAYWRAHTNKTVLYRLTEINIKTGNFAEAQKYCDEFELLSPKDDTGYLLRYRLGTARQDPIEERIRLLEAYREKKFTEKWAYELALLYKESGQDEKCAQLLNDMIVWFPDGKYQDRARTLRSQVVPEEVKPEMPAEPFISDTVEIKTEAPRRRPEKPIAEDAFRRTEDSAVKTQLADSWRTLVSGIRTGEIQLEVPDNVFSFPEEEADDVYVKPDPRKVKDLEPETIGRTTIAPPVPDPRKEDGVQITIDDYMNGSAPAGSGNELDDLFSETSAHLASAVASGRYDRIRTEEKAEDTEVPYGQMSFDDFMPELEDEASENAAAETSAEAADPLSRLYGKETDETLGLTKSYSLEREVVKEIANQEKRKASDEEERLRRKAVAQTLRSAGVIPEEEETLLSEDQWKQEEETETPEAEEIVGEAEPEEASAEEFQSIEDMLREAEEDDEPIIRRPKKNKRAEIGGWIGKLLRPEREEDDFREEEEPEENLKAALSQQPAEEAEAEFSPEPDEPVKEEETEEPEESAKEESPAEPDENAEEELFAEAKETAAEESATRRVQPRKKEKRRGGIFSFLNAIRPEEEEDVDAAEERTEPEAEAEPVREELPAGEEIPAGKENPQEEASSEDLAWIDEWKAAAAEKTQEAEEAAEEAANEAEPEETAALPEEETAEDAAAEDAAAEDAAPESAESPEEKPEEDSTQNLIDAIASQPEVMQKLPVEPRAFDDTEKEIFSYFTKVPGMSEQITMALSDVHNNAGDKTSRSGNIMIIGRQGSGKTHLTDAIMTAVCRDLGIHATRCAKIIASEFNEKNPAEVVSKLMGGFLVIEGAGELSDDAVAKLLRAMEFRTDHLVVMLEDEKADLKSLLLRHPEIEDKFTSTIVIPVFTNDELVAFAKAYAREKGYRMDEMGILALYTMIGDNQSATEPVTVGKVKEMMDSAIEKADSGARRIGRRFSKKSFDKEGRVLLREKDFDI